MSRQQMIDSGDKSNIESNSSAVKIRNLRKEYGDIEAVNSIELSVEPGELLVLLGPSGCGKSTTLRLLAGLELPTSGSILIGGEDVTNKFPRDRGISMVFQSYALYPHKTVRGNLKFPLRKMDLTNEEIEGKIESVAEMLEIAEILDKRPGQISGGQQQRVAVGRTVVREPNVFLMDEPLSNLDAKLRVQTRSEIRELQQRLETTTLYVTHDQEEALSLADRVAVMQHGEIMQVGTPEEVYKTPKNEFVASFLGEPSMNFISGKQLHSDSRFKSLRSIVEQFDQPETITIGVRPEDVYLSNPKSAELDRINQSRLTKEMRFTVGVVEPLGNVYELNLEHKGEFLTLLTENCPNSITSGKDIKIRFDQEEIHAFDADGNAVELNPGGVS